MTTPRFHHLGVAVRDLSAAVATYSRLFGFRLLRGPIDDPLQKVTASFVGTGNAGDIVYELVSPMAGVDKSPVDGVLAKGNTSYHVCYEVSDLDATLARWVDDGCLRISGPVPAVAFEGRRIAWVLMPTRHLIELLEMAA